MGNSYGTGIEIWAGFGPVGITEKKPVGVIMSYEANFSSFLWQK